MKTSSSVNLKKEKSTSLHSKLLLTGQPESLPAPASARLKLEAGVASPQLAEPNNCHQGLLLVFGGGLGPRGAGGGTWGARSRWCPPLPAMLTHVGRPPHNPHIPSPIA